MYSGPSPSAANGASKMCRICSSFAIAYIEMPDEKTVISANEIALKRARLLVEPQPQVLGHRARARAVVERHHEDAEEHHRRDRADPVEVAGRDAVLRARRRHADDFLRAEVRRDERQAADPRRASPGPPERSAVLVVVLRLQREADPQHEAEVDEHQQPVEATGHEPSPRCAAYASLRLQSEAAGTRARAAAAG